MQTVIAPSNSSPEPRSNIPQQPGHPSFPAFSEFVTERVIIRELCAWRVNRASRRSQHLFLHRIRAETRIQKVDVYEAMFPPRRLWHGRRPAKRGDRAGADLNRMALERTIIANINATPPVAWAIKMSSFIKEIQRRAFGEAAFPFTPPRIHAAEKSEGALEHRAITIFSLPDQIIGCLVARYLRQCIDFVFDDASMAFRCRRGAIPPPRHHDAIRQILAKREATAPKPLYIAECDIQGFFDCVDHETAGAAVRKCIEIAERATGQTVDPKALRILDAYFTCYTFPRNVLELSEPSLKMNNPNAFFKWPEQALRRLHRAPREAKLGIPQGGALSGFIANCLLHSADQKLREMNAGDGFLYLRYCDDMILLSPSRSLCRKAFRSYCQELFKLKLPIHLPRRVGRYSARYWDGKSRSVYRWGSEFLWFSRSPWIQFVGYQVRYDGLMRIRKTSFEKQVKKIVNTVDEILAHVRSTPKTGKSQPAVRKNLNQILHRFRMKVISAAVGRRKLHEVPNGPLPMSWCSGFECLNEQPYLSRQLRALDRHRERQYRRLWRKLFDAIPPQPREKDEKSVPVHRHYGRPFSYAGQFRRRDKESGAMN